jgi:acyl carrier protein
MADLEARAARVWQMVGEMSPLGAREARPGDRLVEDLGYDSVALLELALSLEVEFGLKEIEEDEAVDLRTVGDITDLVLAMAPEQS